jgi:hypothetical protein
MSQISLMPPFESISGKFGKNVIIRQKKFRAPNGKVLFKGVKESYPLTNPRDYSKNPPQGAELANINFFGDISRLAAQIINSALFTPDELAAMTEQEYNQVIEFQAQLADFQQRYLDQRKRPDPEAPFDGTPNPNSTVKRRKTYKTLRTFIQAILRERLKNQH